MKKINAITLGLMACILTSCAVTTSPDGSKTYGAHDRLPKLEVEGLSEVEKIKMYEDQLIKKSHQPYATITTYPYIDYRTAWRPAHPVNIYSVNGQRLSVIPYKVFGASSALSMSMADLKLPEGEQEIVVTGLAHDARQFYTRLPKMTFQAGKQYIIKPDFSNDQVTLAVYTYEYDPRFSRFDEDSIILREQITQPVLRGNEKSVFNW